MEKKIRVEILSHTPEPERLVATAGHMCYAGVSVSELKEKMNSEKIKKLIADLIESGHLSVLEHASFTFAIEGVSRALTHQLVRHRIASYCLTGDTIIKGARKKSRGYKKFTLKSLYERTLTPHGKSRLKLINLNNYNEDTKQFGAGKISNIVYTGKNEVWEVKTKDGRTIKATPNHRFLTREGWVSLGDIAQNKPQLAVNGITCESEGLSLLRDKTWLSHQYKKINLTLKQIAENLDCSPYTVRAWVRKHGLQKETGGLHGHPPFRGYHWKLNRERTKEEKALASERMKGYKNHGWRGGITMEAVSLRRQISKDLRKSIYARDGYSCKLCNKTGGKLTLHHKIPLYADKTKVACSENLVTLCKACHTRINCPEQEYSDAFDTEPIPYYSKSNGCYRTVKWVEIESIERHGIEDTYDVTMQGSHHNFVANGFVVHNSQQSQRYVKESEFGFIVPPTIKGNSAMEKEYLKEIEETRKTYKKLVEAGVPKEDARFILPNAAETRIIMTMNARALYNFFERRLCTRAQWEIRLLAGEMLKELQKVSPILFADTGPICEKLGYCPEKKSCGRRKLKKDALCAD